MEIECDPEKDAIDVAKHGVSLARAAELAKVVVVPDDRLRLYGLIDDLPHCAAVALRGDHVRVISLRRAHRKEFRRHV